MTRKILKYQDIIHNYIQNHRGEIIETLKSLVTIPSVASGAEKNAPFGKSCADVLDYTKKLYDENGFNTELDQNGGYLISYFGEGEKTVGLFAHADVVPVNDEWNYTNPFEPIEQEEFLIGRGVLDDKAAVVISLYCAKILNELNIPFNSRLIMFTGANEETGMEDIKAYIKKHKAPDFSLVCDTAFPLYRGNKGMLQFTAVCNISLDKISTLVGSNVKGAILNKMEVKLPYTDTVYNSLKSHESERVSILVENNEIIIKTCGISKHTALPEGSLNAGYLAFKILAECEYMTENDCRQMKFISDLLLQYYGETLGIENTDPEFGKLTFANDMISLENGKIKLHFNLRFGACVDVVQLKNTIERQFSERGWSVEFESEGAAHITDVNHPMLQACLGAYKAFTGYENAEVYINAGGTYAKHLPCAAEIGTTLKWGTPDGFPQGHGGAHQPDECINIDGMLEALELTMLMLLECDKTGE